MTLLAVILLAGTGPSTTSDPDTAVRYLSAAADLGHVPAMNALAACLYAGLPDRKRDCSEAVLWFRRAADLGDASALNNLGICHEEGLGVPRDLAVAKSLYRAAADAGHPGGTNNLAYMLMLEEEWVEALKLLHLAWSLGSADAAFNIGTLHESGCRDAAGPLLDANIDLAIRWYLEASNLGSTKAQVRLGGYLAQTGPHHDEAAAAALLGAAADTGNPDAQVLLAQLVAAGAAGSPPRPADACALLRRATEAGHPLAAFRLAACYEAGVGAPKDRALAFRLLEESERLGCTEARDRLYLLRSLQGDQQPLPQFSKMDGGGGSGGGGGLGSLFRAATRRDRSKPRLERDLSRDVLMRDRHNDRDTADAAVASASRLDQSASSPSTGSSSSAAGPTRINRTADGFFAAPTAAAASSSPSTPSPPPPSSSSTSRPGATAFALAGEEDVLTANGEAVSLARGPSLARVRRMPTQGHAAHDYHDEPSPLGGLRRQDTTTRARNNLPAGPATPPAVARALRDTDGYFPTGASQDSSLAREAPVSSNRERDTEREVRDRFTDRDRGHSVRDRDRDKVDYDRERDRNWSDRDRDRDRERDQRKERDRDRDRDRERGDRDQLRDRDRDRDRDQRDGGQPRDRDRERERDRAGALGSDRDDDRIRRGDDDSYSRPAALQRKDSARAPRTRKIIDDALDGNHRPGGGLTRAATTSRLAEHHSRPSGERSPLLAETVARDRRDRLHQLRNHSEPLASDEGTETDGAATRASPDTAASAYDDMLKSLDGVKPASSPLSSSPAASSRPLVDGRDRARDVRADRSDRDRERARHPRDAGAHTDRDMPAAGSTRYDGSGAGEAATSARANNSPLAGDITTRNPLPAASVLEEDIPPASPSPSLAARQMARGATDPKPVGHSPFRRSPQGGTDDVPHGGAGSGGDHSSREADVRARDREAERAARRAERERDREKDRDGNLGRERDRDRDRERDRERERDRQRQRRDPNRDREPAEQPARLQEHASRRHNEQASDGRLARGMQDETAAAPAPGDPNPDDPPRSPTQEAALRELNEQMRREEEAELVARQRERREALRRDVEREDAERRIERMEARISGEEGAFVKPVQGEAAVVPQFVDDLVQTLNQDMTMAPTPDDFSAPDGFAIYQRTIHAPLQQVIGDLLTERFVEGPRRQAAAASAAAAAAAAPPPAAQSTALPIFLKVVSAEGLKAKDPQAVRELHCRIEVGNNPDDGSYTRPPAGTVTEKFFTEAVRASTTPVWNQHQRLEPRSRADRLIISVWDVAKKDFLGMVKLAIADMVEESEDAGYVSKWYELAPREGRRKDKYVGGELLVEFEFRPNQPAAGDRDNGSAQTEASSFLQNVHSQLIRCRINFKALYRVLLRATLDLDIRNALQDRGLNRLPDKTTDVLGEESRACLRACRAIWLIGEDHHYVVLTALLFDMYKNYLVPVEALSHSFVAIYDGIKSNKSWLSRFEQPGLLDLCDEMYNHYRSQVTNYKEFYPKNKPSGALDSTLFLWRMLYKSSIFRDGHPELPASFTEHCKTLMKQACVSRYKKLLELSAPFDNSDVEAVVDGLVALAVLLTTEIEQDARYFKVSFKNDVDVVRLTSENYLREFVATLEEHLDMIISDESIKSASKGIFTLYRNLRTMDEKYGKLVPG
ncbi:hypothetical protein HK405_003252, partial [Cladochytrium tenue]